MYEIEIQEMSEDFFPCWQAAGNHLNRQVDSGILSWLRAHPHPPFLEHLSFRLGNQLFFIRVEDVAGKAQGPGTRHGLAAVASDANGHACLMLMKKQLLSGGWMPDRPGWGLVDAQTGRPIDPVALVTNEKIEMSAWEIHHLAVQVVRDYLQNQGFQLMSWQGNPEVDPSIWFVGKTKNPECVIVRSAKFPANRAERPNNWDAILQHWGKMNIAGHFASVAVVSTDQPFESSNEAAVPLWRGYSMHVRFTGLE